jgi:hypothetical protein
MGTELSPNMCSTLCSHETCTAMEDLALKLEAAEGGTSRSGLHTRSKRSVPTASSKAVVGASSKATWGPSCVVKLRNIPYWAGTAVKKRLDVGRRRREGGVD